MFELDALDVRLLTELTERPRANVVELSRVLEVSRATVQARMDRLERGQVVTGYGPDVDLEQVGYTMTALVTLEIAQGRLLPVGAALAAVPQVVEAYGTTGPGDVFCRVVARSHDELQGVLLRVSQIPDVTRSTSVVALTTLVTRRFLPLLHAERRPEPRRVKPHATATPETPPR